MYSGIYFLVTLLSLKITEAYRYGVFDGEQLLCNPELTCGNQMHTACYVQLSPTCRNFRYFKTTSSMRRRIVHGHNGIRNKVAKEFQIANMNLLHWSRDLEILAKLFLRKCQTLRDTCKFLVWENITIRNNVFMSNRRTGYKWPIRMIRAWYFEAGFEIIDNIGEFIYDWETAQIFPNFRQIVWPTSEFIGCAAAQTIRGLQATCYYTPAMTPEWEDWTLGEPCRACPMSRRVCSSFFRNTCGIDDINVGVVNRKLSIAVEVILWLFCCFQFIYYV